MNFKKIQNKFWARKASGEEGFTLVELIVVIAILGILAGVGTVAYSGYIKKANIAADQQLLDAVNTAFYAACVSNGTDAYLIDAAVLPLTGDKTVGDFTSVQGFTGETLATFNNSFDQFYEGNETAAFKQITSIIYDAALHMFIDPMTASDLTIAYGGGVVKLTAEALAALKESTFVTNMTSKDLLDQVNDVVLMAGDMSGTLGKVFGSTDFQLSAAAALGISAEGKSEEDILRELGTECQRLAAQMVAEGKAPDVGTAIKTIQANAAVLYTARNTTNMNAEKVQTLLSSANSNSVINNLSSNDEAVVADGLAQAALVYGMYTAYVNSSACTDPAAKENVEATDVLNALDGDENFQKYMSSEQGQKDLEGYLGALEMVNSSSNSTAAVEQLMLNGFNDPALIEILNQSVGK